MHSVVLFVAGFLAGVASVFGLSFAVVYLDDKQPDFWAG